MLGSASLVNVLVESLGAISVVSALARILIKEISSFAGLLGVFARKSRRTTVETKSSPAGRRSIGRSEGRAKRSSKGIHGKVRPAMSGKPREVSIQLKSGREVVLDPNDVASIVRAVSEVEGSSHG